MDAGGTARHAGELKSGTPSLRARHSGLLQDFGPAYGFRLDEAVELPGRAFAARNELKVDKLLFDLGLGDGRIHRAVELRDDLRWRCARRCDRLPGRPVEAWDADFGERRDVRRRGGALRRRHAERADLARLDQRISRREIAEHQLNMTGNDVIER